MFVLTNKEICVVRYDFSKCLDHSLINEHKRGEATSTMTLPLTIILNLLLKKEHYSVTNFDTYFKMCQNICACILQKTFVSGATAVRDSSCPRICTQNAYGDPVCGSDGIIYPNICEMKKKTCGKGEFFR